MKGQFSPLRNASTSQLLATRICDLGLSIRDTNVVQLRNQLNTELAAKNLRFKPAIWISTAWFSPYGVPGFAIPFYLLHPRLCELEQKYIGEVEGGTDEWCMKLLRHETGHAIDNAFHLRKSKRRQALFGLSKTPYPERYKPHRDSTDFVRHLSNHYAQSHPDEDWAETFAVWLDPKSKWRTAYKNTEALAKIELVNELVSGVAGQGQLVRRVDKMEEISSCRLQLVDYLRAKRKKYRVSGSWIKM